MGENLFRALLLFETKVYNILFVGYSQGFSAMNASAEKFCVRCCFIKQKNRRQKFHGIFEEANFILKNGV